MRLYLFMFIWKPPSRTCENAKDLTASRCPLAPNGRPAGSRDNEEDEEEEDDDNADDADAADADVRANAPFRASTAADQSRVPFSICHTAIRPSVYIERGQEYSVCRK